MSRPSLAIACSTVALTLIASRATAQCAHWDTGFEAPGFDGVIHAELVFDDGSGPALYVAGEFLHAPGVSAPGIARWNGTTWSPVGAGINGLVNALAVFDDGSGPKLIAGGYFVVGATNAGAVFEWTGSQWTQLGPVLPPEGQSNDRNVIALAAFDDGTGPHVYAGGSFASAVRRLEGSTWTVVGNGLSRNPFDDVAQVEALVVFDDGSGPALYAGGQFDRLGNGQAPNTLNNVARLSGATWTGVGGGLGWDDVTSLCGFDDGSGPKLIAGGSLQVGPTQTPAHVARFANGAWSPFASDVNGVVTSLAAFDAASGIAPGLWVGGSFTQAGNVHAVSLARFDGAAWNAVGDASLFGTNTLVAAFDDGTGHGVRAFGAGGNGIVATLDGMQWNIPGNGSGPNAAVNSLCVLHGPGSTRELWATGSFTLIGGSPALQVAHSDGAHWQAETLPGTSLLTGRVYALDMGSGEEIYLTGNYLGIGSGYRNLLHRVGGVWSAMPDVPVYPFQIPTDLVVFDAGDGKHLYAGGAYGVWRLDGNAWTSLTGLLDYPVYCLAVHDDGSGPALYFGGQFSHIGPVPATSIARWTPQGISAVGGGANAFSFIYDLQTWDDGTGPALYVCGGFNTLGGSPANSIGKWDGHAWSEVGGGLHGNYPSANVMTVHDDGSGSGAELVIAGFFDNVGGQNVGRIARWNGSAWNTMDGGVSVGIPGPAFNVPRVYALAALDLGDGHGATLYAGGQFEQAGTLDSYALARWTSCGGDATMFCYGDGSGTACPCGNASAIGDRAGCLSSLGIGGTLRTHGRASLGDDTLVLEGGSMTNSAVLYYQGANVVNGGAGVVFGDGVKCTAGPFVRLGTKLNVNGASMYPGSTDPRLSVRGQITSAGTRYYQVRYRNSAPFCTPDTFNYTSGVSVAWSN